MNNIIVTTTPSIEGHTITKYLGLVSYRAWAATNIILVGGVNNKNIEKYREFIQQAQDGLRAEAAALGANAVVGVQLLPPDGKLASTMLTSGTAVIVE